MKKCYCTKFIFVFIWYFNGVVLAEKSCQKRRVWKKYKKGDGYIGGIQTFCTQWIFYLSLKRRNLQNNRTRSSSTFWFWFSNEISIFPLIFALLADSRLALDNYWGGGIIITKLITSFLYSIFEFKG